MLLKKLLAKIPYNTIQGSDNIDIENICWDSRKVTPNSLFICVNGRNVDRHQYALQAVSAGAIALIIQHDLDELPKNVHVYKVDNSKSTMASIANTFFHEPSKRLKLVGVTGTNGKTSTSYFIAKILELAGYKTGVIGTLENTINSKKLQTEKLNPTTPDSMELQASLSEMLKEEASHVVMEVTSSALSQYRVHSCNFQIGVFTNLTQDHLEEHGTMENYKSAKIKLFKMCAQGVINTDDPFSEDIISNATCEIITYGINKAADFNADDVFLSSEGSTFVLHHNGMKCDVTLNIPGRFSIYNALAAAATCSTLGLSLKQITLGLSMLQGVKGRFQVVPNSKDYTVIIDYAHTPDALDNILSSAKSISNNKVILVFGCGGDRDKTKRPIMGEIAGKKTNYCIITSDNPRNENPYTILDDIEAGIINTPCSYKKIIDRKSAINYALERACPYDVVIIAGKGHESYQIIGDKIIPFDDYAVVQEFFRTI